ncbi:curli-like amyloid fiber formation chaperone CsgH [Rhodobacteraceae bacterium D3-12]|nr:curli-like amyloid fiber formation chaperone CsgH [Rhodobacteraceae bacterium D3-12]
MHIGDANFPKFEFVRARKFFAVFSGLVALFVLFVCLAAPIRSQSLVRLQCSAKIDTYGQTIVLYGLIMSDVAVSVDYEIEVVSMSSGNLGSASQGGTLALEAGRPLRTSSSQITIAGGGGYYEIEITATDRLTGSKCTDKNTFVL